MPLTWLEKNDQVKKIVKAEKTRLKALGCNLKVLPVSTGNFYFGSGKLLHWLTSASL